MKKDRIISGIGAAIGLCCIAVDTFLVRIPNAVLFPILIGSILLLLFGLILNIRKKQS